MTDISGHTWLLLLGLVILFLGGQELLAIRGRRQMVRKVIAATREDALPGYGAIPYAILEMIDQLRADEGSSVELVSDNADFNGLPDRAIVVSGDWTDWEPRTFRADLIVDCLALAIAAKREHGNG